MQSHEPARYGFVVVANDPTLSRSTSVVAGALAQDPLIEFERGSDGPWTLHDRRTNERYRSGSDSSPPAALAGRYSRALPLVASRSRAIAAYAPLLLLIPLFLVIPVIIAAGLVAGVVSRIRPVVALWRDRRVVTVGRVALAAVGLAALPGFVSALVAILGPA